MQGVIYKYELAVIDHQTIVMPGLIQVLSVQNQNDKLCAWAAVQPHDPEAPLVTLNVYIVGTGHEMPEEVLIPGVLFSGTVQMGSFVWHVFMSVKQ